MPELWILLPFMRVDLFVFGFDGGQDVYTDFNVAEGDMLRIDNVLWEGNLSVTQILATHGSVSNGTLTPRFDGGEQLVMNGVICRRRQ